MKALINIMAAIVCACSVAGCATNWQNFNDDLDDVDRVWEIVQQPDGEWVSILKSESIQRHIVQGKNKTNAPPFGGSAVANNQLDMTDADEWTVKMGQASDLYGGDMTAIVQGLIDAGVLTATGGVSALTRLGQD